jgi:hypothetical protein
MFFEDFYKSRYRLWLEEEAENEATKISDNMHTDLSRRNSSTSSLSLEPDSENFFSLLEKEIGTDIQPTTSATATDLDLKVSICK